MKSEIYFGEYYAVETTDGTEIIPVDVSGRVNYVDDLKMYLNGNLIRQAGYSFALGQPLKGFLARLTMPGYLDCTDWTVHESEEAAREYLEDAYGAAD